MGMSEKCCKNDKHNNSNSDNPLISRRTDGGKNTHFYRIVKNQDDVFGSYIKWTAQILLNASTFVYAHSSAGL